MFINEKILFDHIFFGKELPEEYKESGKGDSRINQELTMLRQIKSAMNDKPSLLVRAKLAAKIPFYTGAIVVTMLPEETLSTRIKQSSFRAAAAADILQRRDSTITFINKKENLIVRLIEDADNNVTRLFVLSTVVSILHDFTITLYPDEKTYPFENNLNPLVLKGFPKIDKITVSLTDEKY